MHKVITIFSSSKSPLIVCFFGSIFFVFLTAGTNHDGFCIWFILLAILNALLMKEEKASVEIKRVLSSREIVVVADRYMEYGRKCNIVYQDGFVASADVDMCYEEQEGQYPVFDKKALFLKGYILDAEIEIMQIFNSKYNCWVTKSHNIIRIFDFSYTHKSAYS